MKLWMSLVKGVFRTFPQNKKSAKLGPHSGSELLPQSSPSTRRAYAVPTVPEEEEPVLAESEEEPHVVEVGPLPWEVVLAWYWPGRGHHLGGARLGFLGSDMGCGCFFWFFEMGVVLVSASFWTTLLLRGYEAAAVSG